MESIRVVSGVTFAQYDLVGTEFVTRRVGDNFELFVGPGQCHLPDPHPEMQKLGEVFPVGEIQASRGT